MVQARAFGVRLSEKSEIRCRAGIGLLGEFFKIKLKKTDKDP